MLVVPPKLTMTAKLLKEMARLRGRKFLKIEDKRARECLEVHEVYFGVAAEAWASGRSGSHATFAEVQEAAVQQAKENYKAKILRMMHMKMMIKDKARLERLRKAEAAASAEEFPWRAACRSAARRSRSRPPKKQKPAQTPEAAASKATAAPKQAASEKTKKKKKGGVKRVGERIKRLEAEGTPEALAQAFHDRWMRAKSSKQRNKRKWEKE
jgi:hypothetical protein